MTTMTGLAFLRPVRLAAALLAALGLICAAGVQGEETAGGPGTSARSAKLVVTGADRHVETTLIAALSRVLSVRYGGEVRSIDELATPSEHGNRGLAISASHASVRSARRTYTLHHPLSHTDYVKLIITGAVQFDGAILVVSATRGPAPQTRAKIFLAHQVGVPSIVVYLNDADTAEDEQHLMLVETEIRQLLGAYGFPGDNTPVIRGSARKALKGDRSQAGEPSVMRLAKALDSHIPDPASAMDGPFLMPVEDVFSISGRGTVVTGRVQRGSVKVGDEIEIVGLRSTRQATVTGVEMFRKRLEEAVAGDNVGVLLRDIARKDIQRGQVLAKPHSITAHTDFQALVYVLSKEEGGRHTPFFQGFRPQFYFRTTNVTGTIKLPEDIEQVMPGDNVSMNVALSAPVAMEEGLRFALRQSGRTVGAGVVTKVIQ